MAACATFIDPLGYDSYPADHHVNGITARSAGGRRGPARRLRDRGRA
ncbi:hypothetical protein [Oryzicola mucosus]|uniref:Uncharacterized protein n=1 Tax=Oryzicola mucosus TaxID=2767425 RepID=A0A8J6U1Z8_9HYPH|nr:hypothetical protein [Oryzicola mucosus]MBD0415138.1 hypothetical protein [Oryzicola mucosus]